MLIILNRIETNTDEIKQNEIDQIKPLKISFKEYNKKNSYKKERKKEASI